METVKSLGALRHTVERAVERRAPGLKSRGPECPYNCTLLAEQALNVSYHASRAVKTAKNRQKSVGF